MFATTTELYYKCIQLETGSFKTKLTYLCKESMITNTANTIPLKFVVHYKHIVVYSITSLLQDSEILHVLLQIAVHLPPNFINTMR